MKNHMRLCKYGLVSVACLPILFGMVACQRLPAESSPSVLHTSATTVTTSAVAKEGDLDFGAADATEEKPLNGTTVTTSTVAEEDSLDFGAADTTVAQKTVTTTTKVTTATKSTTVTATKSEATAVTKTTATDWYGRDEGYLPVIPW